jgi:hypothetical protein
MQGTGEPIALSLVIVDSRSVAFQGRSVCQRAELPPYREMNNDFPQSSNDPGVRQRFVDRDGSNGNAGGAGRLSS